MTPIKSDNHVHTEFSTDSKTPMEEMISKGISLGLESICFTDHMDFDFPSKGQTPEFLLDTDFYMETLQHLSEKYCGKNFSIRRGIELGIKPEIAYKCKKITSEYNFDFVIASTHLVDNTDPYYPDFWKDKSEQAAIIRYYEATLENIECDIDFDVYGHIDYIMRYTPQMTSYRSDGIVNDCYIDKCLDCSMDIIEEILKKIIYLGKGIEINTAGLKYGIGHTNPHERVLKLYQSLGGEIITVGSDAHEPKHLAYDFAKVPELLKSCGFKYYTEFHGRSPKMISLN